MQIRISLRVVASCITAGCLLTGSLSCGGDRPTAPTRELAASLELFAGDQQTGTVATELSSPVKVRVLDAHGHPVADQLINFRVTAGGGTMFAGSAITTMDGIAADRWTLGTVAGVQTVEARAVDASTGAALVFGTFHANAVADVPATIVKVAGDAQTGAAGTALADSVAVKVADKYANPISRATVTFAPAAAAGTVRASSVTTDTAGIARTSWTLGTSTAVAQQVVAAAGSVSTTFTAMIVPGPAAGLVLRTPAAGAQSNVPFATQPVLGIVDAYGNVVPAAPTVVTISVSTGASIMGTPAVPYQNGAASFINVGLSAPAGSYTISYAASLPSGTLTIAQLITVTVGAPAALAVVAQPSATAQSGLALAGPPVLQLRDAQGAPVSQGGVVVTASLAGVTGATAAGTTTSVTDANGRATFAALRIDGAVGMYSFTFAANGLASATSNAVAVAAGPPARLGFVQQPTGAGRLAVIAPFVSVAVQDQFGNTVTTSGDAVTLTLTTNPNGAVFTGGGPVAPSNGVATFAQAMLDRAGSGYVLTARSASGLSVVSTSFNSSPVAVVATGTTFVDATGTSTNMQLDALTRHDSVITFVEMLGDVGPSARGWPRSVPTVGGNSRTLTHLIQMNGPSLASDTQFSYMLYTAFTGQTASVSCLFFQLSPTGADSLATPFRLDYDTCTAPLAAAGGYLYFVSRSGVERFNVATGDTTIVASQGQSFALANGVIYYFDAQSKQIKSVSAGGGSPAVVSSVTGTNVPALAVTGGTLYWLETTQPASGPTTTSIVSAPTGGGGATVRVSGLVGFTHSLVTDGVVLYVIQNDQFPTGCCGGSYTGGELRRYVVADFSMTVVDEQVRDVVLDDENVYWTARGTASQLKKAAK